MLSSLTPHMHFRGKSFEFRLVTPDGSKEVLLSVPKYDFGWQETYILAEPRSVPKGSRMECTAHYDNSAGNPNNPNPRALVTWGDQSWDEMMLGYIDYYFADPPGPKATGKAGRDETSAIGSDSRRQRPVRGPGRSRTGPSAP